MVLLTGIRRKFSAIFYPEYNFVCLMCVLRPWTTGLSFIGAIPFKIQCAHHLDERFHIKRSIPLLLISYANAVALFLASLYEYWVIYDGNSTLWEYSTMHALILLAVGINCAIVIALCTYKATRVTTVLNSIQIVLKLAEKVDEVRLRKMLSIYRLKAWASVTLSVSTLFFAVYRYWTTNSPIELCLFPKLYVCTMCSTSVTCIFEGQIGAIEIVYEKIAHGIRHDYYMYRRLVKVIMVMYKSIDITSDYLNPMVTIHVLSMIGLGFLELYTITLSSTALDPSSIWFIAFTYLLWIWYSIVTIYPCQVLERYLYLHKKQMSVLYRLPTCKFDSRQRYQIEATMRLISAQNYALKSSILPTISMKFLLTMFYRVFTFVLVGIQFYVATVLKNN